MRMASAPENSNNSIDERLTQCLIMIVKEQYNQKQTLQNLFAEIGRLREDMSGEFRKMQHTADSINGRLTSVRYCVCGANAPGNSYLPGGATHKRPRRPPQLPYEDSDDSTDPNMNNDRRQKSADKPSLSSLQSERNKGSRRPPPESPVPLGTNPPRHLPKPVVKSKSTRSRKSGNYNMQKQTLHNKALIKAQPQESDFIELMKSVNLEVNRTTVAAVASVAAEISTNNLVSRPPALNTILIIDTSESMRGQPFEAAKIFVNKMLDDIDISAGEFGLEEYIAVITCGQSVGIERPFTNDFLQIRNIVDNLNLHIGGRTPLMTSLVLALCYLERQSDCVKMVDHVINPRLIVISDFDATLDKQAFSGRDQDNSEDRIKVQRELFNLGLTFKNQGYTVVCVPVGQSNDPVAKGFASKSNGDVIKLECVQEIGCYYRYQMLIGRAFSDRDAGDRDNQDVDVYTIVQDSLAAGGLNKSHEAGLTKLLDKVLNKIDDIDSDEEFVFNDVKYMGGNSKEYIRLEGNHVGNAAGNFAQNFPGNRLDPPDLPEWTLTRNLDSIGFEEVSGLPAIGSRVRRGKDWKWDNQDDCKPGTVVGHKQKGIAFVLWDNGNIGAYRHGYDGTNDIQRTQEPRHVEPGKIEVGCCVIRGADWERGDEDGGVGTIGVVVRKLRDRYVKVRWPSRVIETYRFGADEKWELEVTLGTPPTRGANTPLSLSENGTPTSHEATEQNGGNRDRKPWWSWQDTHKQWRPFSEDSVEKIELKYNTKSMLQHCIVEYKDKQMKVFVAENVCDIEGQKFPIKREMLNADEIESMKMLEELLQPID